MLRAMKIDLKREVPFYRATQGRFDLVTLPPMRYLTVDGHGDPNTSDDYTDALASLYPVAYALKFLSKNELGRDYTVMPLEGLWWSDDPEVFTTRRDKTQWKWTLLILVPDWLGDEHVGAARASAETKSGPGVRRVRSAMLDEGLSLQTLHIGSYDDEAPVLQRLHDEEIPARGLRMTGVHHEVYLSDARRTAPEKLRTILRQPVSPA